MDQFARFTRRASRELGLLDNQHGIAIGRDSLRDADPVNSAAYDDHIVFLFHSDLANKSKVLELSIATCRFGIIPEPPTIAEVKSFLCDFRCIRDSAEFAKAV